MSAQTLQMDIDQRGKSWWNFIDLWQTAPCFTTRSMYSLSLFSIPFSLGAFNAPTCSGWGTQRWRSTWKALTDVWESVLRGSSGLLVRAFDLRDWRTASQGFGCCCIFLVWLQRECKKQRETPVMWKILHRCCVCFSHSVRHFVFMQLACCFYVLWPRSAVENIWLIPSGWAAIVNFIRTIALGQHRWLTTGTTKMLPVFQVWCREKSVASEAEENRGISYVRHSFDQ